MGVVEATAFVTSALLVCIGLIVIVAGILIINNMIHRWWKPLNWSIIPESFRGMWAAEYENNPYNKVKQKK